MRPTSSSRSVTAQLAAVSLFQLSLTVDTHSLASVSVIHRACQRWMEGSAYAATSAGTSPTVHGRNVNSSTYKTGWACPRVLPGMTTGATVVGTSPECHLGVRSL